MIIYTGERARAMRRGERPAKMPKAALPVRAAAPAQSAAEPGDASPLLREMKATTVDEDDAEVAKLPSVREPGHPDYVPPSVAEQVELERAAARARGDAMQTVTVLGADDELDTLPPTSTSRPPKAPRDRTYVNRHLEDHGINHLDRDRGISLFEDLEGQGAQPRDALPLLSTRSTSRATLARNRRRDRRRLRTLLGRRRVSREQHLPSGRPRAEHAVGEANVSPQAAAERRHDGVYEAVQETDEGPRHAEDELGEGLHHVEAPPRVLPLRQPHVPRDSLSCNQGMARDNYLRADQNDVGVERELEATLRHRRVHEALRRARRASEAGKVRHGRTDRGRSAELCMLRGLEIVARSHASALERGRTRELRQDGRVAVLRRRTARTQGGRWDLVVVDDPSTSKNSRTSAQRKKLREQRGGAAQAGVGDGEIVYLNTPRQNDGDVSDRSTASRATSITSCTARRCGTTRRPKSRVTTGSARRSATTIRPARSSGHLSASRRSARCRTFGRRSCCDCATSRRAFQRERLPAHRSERRAPRGERWTRRRPDRRARPRRTWSARVCAFAASRSTTRPTTCSAPKWRRLRGRRRCASTGSETFTSRRPTPPVEHRDEMQAVFDAWQFNDSEIIEIEVSGTSRKWMVTLVHRLPAPQGRARSGPFDHDAARLRERRVVDDVEGRAHGPDVQFHTHRSRVSFTRRFARRSAKNSFASSATAAKSRTTISRTPPRA
jgi:hypothetical protein